MTSSVAISKWQKDIFGVCDSDFEILTELYQISPAMLNDYVVLIRDWYSKQSPLLKIEFDNRILERILAVNKFSVEKTKHMMNNAFASKNLIPEFFSNRDPWSEELSTALDSIDWAFIPKLTTENYRVHFIKINGDDPDAFDPEAAFAVIFMIAYIRLSLDIAVGDIYVCDLENLKLKYLTKITPQLLKKAIFIAQACCYGSHIKGIHLLNIPPYAKFLINIFKSVMKKKIAERVHGHRTGDDLFKALPKEFIPKDKGGHFPKTTREMADLLRKAMKSPEWRKIYMESMQLKTDDAKRTSDSETMDDELQGLRGSFRKLEID